MRLALVLFCLVIAVGGPTLAQSLAPHYTVDGTNPDGSRYHGTAELFFSPRLDVYSVTWSIAGQTWNGTGVFIGKGGHFQIEYDGGVAVYAIQPNGVLDGRWGPSLKRLNGREVWYPQ